MALMKMPTYVGGGGSKCASGYYASNVPETITTGFKPKKIICTFKYAGAHTMACIYDEDNIGSTSYIRRYDAAQTSYNLPQTGNYAGLHDVTSTGFSLNTNTDFTEFYYIAEG